MFSFSSSASTAKPPIAPKDKTEFKIASPPYSQSAIVDPVFLYRYPQNADPPPEEVKHFCLPAGALLKTISSEIVLETAPFFKVLYCNNLLFPKRWLWHSGK